jgi:hypothetical protein
MRKMLIALPGLILLLFLALILRKAQYGHRCTTSESEAEQQRLRSEIDRASNRLKEISKPKQFLPR